MPAMKYFLLLHHPKVSQSLEFAQQWLNDLEKLGARVSLLSAWDEPSIIKQAPGADLAITLGGDGTLLRVARACAPLGIPIFGVNFGRVGFLSEVVPDQFDPQALIDGKYWIEERTMLHALCARAGRAIGEFEALNDVVVGRGKLARVIRLATSIDGDYVKTFVADGAIVATATGSTAYVFAAGGPILAPEVKTLVLVPIAPYLSQMKSLVLPEGSHVFFRLETDHNAILTVDGQIDVELQNGDEVLVQASKHVAKFARLQNRTYFYRTLVERLSERDGDNREDNGKTNGK
jgi:NAD+ kinase